LSFASVASSIYLGPMSDYMMLIACDRVLRGKNRKRFYGCNGHFSGRLWRVLL